MQQLLLLLLPLKKKKILVRLGRVELRERPATRSMLGQAAARRRIKKKDIGRGRQSNQAQIQLQLLPLKENNPIRLGRVEVREARDPVRARTSSSN